MIIQDLYLQKVGQSNAPGPGATGTTKPRSTLTGPRPPTFKASSRKIFQSTTISSPITSPSTPTSTQMESAVNGLSLSSPNALGQRSPSPILESMGEAPPEPAVMESMGSDGHEPAIPHSHPHPHSQHYGTYNGQGYGSQPNWSGYGTMPTNYHQLYYNPNQPQGTTHLSQEQYLQLQQQHYQQQQEYLRQQHSDRAAAHGYLPTLPGLPAPGSTHLQQPAPQTQSKTISPRIVPIVPIPKYTIVVPPKTEIETLNDDEQDEDWAPEPPPRDPPKSGDNKPPSQPSSRSHTPVLPLTGFSSSSNGFVSTQFEPETTTSTLSSDSLSSLKEEDRIPLPEPREFRRKSVTPPLPPTPVNRPTPSFFIPGSNKSSTNTSSILSGSAFTKPSSTDRSDGKPTPGTVRANSEKFNALATGGGTTSSASSSSILGPRPFTSKNANSSASSTHASATATSNPWTTRKAVDNLRRNSLSKGSSGSMLSGFVVPKSRRLSEAAPSSVILPKETFVDKELPPIRSSMPASMMTGSGAGESVKSMDLSGVPYDTDYDSKCVLTDEHKEDASLPAPPASAFADSAPPVLPLAEEGSKETLVGVGKQRDRSRSSSPTTPSSSAPRNNGTNSSSSGVTPSGFICSSCNEAISGMMITAMGKRWHSDHFVCTVCNTNLEHVQFFQRDGLPYCHFDYHDKFSPKCGHCNSAIENECLTALGKSWHPGHFFCRECGDPFEEDGYMVHDDFPYCEKDYLRLFAPKCAGCQDPIQGDFISALKGKWHRDCFGCTVCHIGFDTTSYYVENGKPYCQAHYKNGAAGSGVAGAASIATQSA
ncbi:hypothetical protein CPC16_005543 [Podila verticillata]|nr:hypothetical protein CPC16_005543 [Podila verticillata]